MGKETATTRKRIFGEINAVAVQDQSSTFPAPVTAAIERVNRILEKRANYRAVLDATVREIQTAEAESGQALEALGEFAADAALRGDEGDVTESPAAARFRASRERIDSLVAKRTVLLRRVGDDDDELFAAKNQLGYVLDDLATARLEQLLAQHASIARQYSESIELLAAFSHATGIHLSGIHETRILQPRNSMEELIPRQTPILDETNNRWNHVPAWTGYEGARALFEEINPLAEVRKRIEQECSAVQKRRADAAKQSEAAQTSERQREDDQVYGKLSISRGRPVFDPDTVTIGPHPAGISSPGLGGA